MRGMAGSTGLPSREDLAQLPVETLVGQLLIALEQVQRLAVRVEQLERQARRDSSNSSKPPSSDSVFTKQTATKPAGRRDRSLREGTGRRPGKQPGDPGATMQLVEDPDARVACAPAAWSGCQRDPSDAPVRPQQRPP